MTRQPTVDQVAQPNCDRDLILLRAEHDRMGIAAALRQAFEYAANDRSQHDFDRLLSELH